MEDQPRIEDRRLSATAILLLAVEALPIPLCLIGAVFALIDLHVLFKAELGTLLVWAVMLYPVIWTAVLIRATKLAALGRQYESTALTAIPAMIIVPAFVVVLAFG